MTDGFAPPLSKLRDSGIGVAAAPAGGMGLALNDKGFVPTSTLIEPWIEITSMDAGWANVASSPTLAYCKDALGFVHFKGLVGSPAGATTGSGTNIFTLPDGYRPPTITYLATRFDTGGTGRIGFVSITTGGVVGAQADGVAANTVITSAIFDGLNFRVATT